MSIPSADRSRVNQLLNVFDQVISRRYVANSLVGLTEQTRECARKATIEHHKQFVDRFIDQDKVDPYKIVSWYGFFLSQHADDPNKHILEACLRTLNHMLEQENLKQGLSEPQILHLYNMARLDGCKDEFGVGKNGIYSVFSSCLDLTKGLAGSFVAKQITPEDMVINRNQ